MKAQDIRNAYVTFFEDRGHYILKRAPLVLHDDPTTLFTGSGMQPMIPYLLGEKHPKGSRLADSQTCFRANDVDEVGDNRHTTFFEMLGNWSLGDYYKNEQIRWFFEFLTDVVGITPERLYVTCYIGNETFGIPKDTEAATIWAKLFAEKDLSHMIADIGSEADGAKRGIRPNERIFFYDGSKNWWSRNGNEVNTPVDDPCGPDTEVFYELDFVEHDPKFGEHCHPNCDCGHFIEIGNSVFMAYRKVSDKKFELLDAPNVDFGGGLERIAQASIHSADMFKISLLWPIIEKLSEISGKQYDNHTASMRIIADHLRAATFLAVDGCVPSNKEQGYVMRRLLRRAMVKAYDLGIENNFMQEVVPVIADLYANDFPEVAENREAIIAVLVKEEKAFRQTLAKGSKQLQKFSEEAHEEVSGETVFTLYDTYGYPPELTAEVIDLLALKPLAENWRQVFDANMTAQRERSRTAGKGEFKGGLAGHDMIHLKYHTATHLLGQALREVVSNDIQQHGSNITSERLRFDFNGEKLSDEQKKAVEDLVNKWIDEDHPVSYQVYPTQEALDMGAIGAFGERYGEDVKVYQIGTADERISFEVCGGPHVEHTGQLGEDGKRFTITKEEASSAGIRRIKAVLR